MKVFLSVPPPSQIHTMMPDLGLGYIATGLRKHAHTVTIYQGEKDADFTGFRERLLAFQPDLVGLKVYSLEIRATREAIKHIRELFPSVPIVLGGPHISVMEPDKIHGFFQGVQYAIQGEAELSLPLLTDMLEHGSADFHDVPGLVYLQNDRVLVNPPIYHSNIDDFGFPAWDLMDPRQYTDRWFFWNPATRGAPFLTSRGCPYRCAFCAQNVVGGKKVRRRSLNSVFRELEYLQREFGITDFEFLDDNFLMDAQYVRALCEGILQRGWNITWSCGGARLENLSIDLLKLIESAGCRIISVGIESGTQRVLDYMQKDITMAFIREKTNMIATHSNIKIMGMFILGYPTETIAEIRRTIDYSLRLPIFAATYFTYIVFPGCLQYERLKMSGEIDNIPWEELGADGHPYAPAGVPYQQLKRLYKLAYMRFYFRPRIVLGIIRFSWYRLPLFVKRSIGKWIWKKH